MVDSLIVFICCNGSSTNLLFEPNIISGICLKNTSFSLLLKICFISTITAPISFLKYLGSIYSISNISNNASIKIVRLLLLL